MNPAELADIALCSSLRTAGNLGTVIEGLSVGLTNADGQKAAFERQAVLAQLQAITQALTPVVRHCEGLSKVQDRLHRCQAPDEKDLALLSPLLQDEDACRVALERVRWPAGPVCARCESTRVYLLATRSLYECAKCDRQFSVTSDSLLQGTHLGLRVWLRLFLGFFRFPSESLAALQRRLHYGRYETLRQAKSTYEQCLQADDPLRASAGLLGLIAVAGRPDAVPCLREASNQLPARRNDFMAHGGTS